jgi:hypothetical protein
MNRVVLIKHVLSVVEEYCKIIDMVKHMNFDGENKSVIAELLHNNKCCSIHSNFLYVNEQPYIIRYTGMLV